MPVAYLCTTYEQVSIDPVYLPLRGPTTVTHFVCKSYDLLTAEIQSAQQ